MLSFIKISIISIFLFLSIDFFFGDKLINFYFSDSKPIIKHPVYHHDLDRNISKSQIYNNIYKHQLCTNDYGMKSFCNYEKKSKKIDYAFIGDSFTEGVGLNYEDTFSGLFQNYKKDKKILNFGVESYSPKIYYRKIKYYLDYGFTLNRLIVFVDIGDIYDENLYTFLDDKVQQLDSLNSINLIYKKQNFYFKVKKKLKSFFKISYIVYSKVITLKNKALKNKNSEEYIEKDNFLINSRWTYDNEFSQYDKVWIENGKKEALLYMEKLFELTKKNNIKLSLAVYPWPAQILHDKNTGLRNYSSLWKTFCEQKCEYFINFNEDYHNLKKKYSNNEIVEKYFFNGDVHFNKEGNYLIFNKLKEIFNE